MNRQALHRISLSMLTVSAIAASAADAQERRSGPVVHSGGTVFVVDPNFSTPTDQDYKVAFDIAAPAPSPDAVNSSINTVARFLNMHAQAGVPQDRLSGAIVAHGGASFELLNDEAYRARYGVDNPNGDIIRELIASGQPVLLCGQSAASRDVSADDLIPGVEVALSAMTAFLVLQERGYRVNPW
ncbi:MAG: DsrE family protein [Gemmatimonadota bacterium]